MTHLRICAILAVLLAASGCSALFGVDGLRYEDAGGDGPGGAPGSGGAGTGGSGAGAAIGGGGTSQACGHEASWSLALGRYGKQHVRSVAATADGGSVVAGYFTTEIAIDGELIEGSDSYAQMFIARLDASGSSVWTTVLAGTDRAWPEQVAVDGDRVVLVGAFAGTLDAGFVPLVSQGGLDLFIIELGEDGGAKWGKSYGSATDDAAQAVAIGPAGAVYAGGFVSGNVDFGFEMQTGQGGRDAVVLKLDSLGSPVWSELFGPTGDQYVRGLGVDGAGTVTVGGYFYSAFAVGLRAYQADGDSDMFLLHMGIIGDVTGVQTFGSGVNAVGNEDDRLHGLALDPSGNALIVGAASFDVTIGDETFPGAGGDDLLVASFDPSGGLRWAKLLGDERRQVGYGVAVGDDGTAFVTGYYEGTIDFGCGPLPDAGAAPNVFLAALSESGAHLWSSGFAVSGEQDITFLGDGYDWRGWRSVTVGPSAVVLGGFFEGSLDLGAGVLSNRTRDIDGFVASFPR